VIRPPRKSNIKENRIFLSNGLISSLLDVRCHQQQYHFFFGSSGKDFTINSRSCSTMVSSPMFLSRGLVATLALAQTFGLASGAERFNEIKV
jgi:hypothetical protein